MAVLLFMHTSGEKNAEKLSQTLLMVHCTLKLSRGFKETTLKRPALRNFHPVDHRLSRHTISCSVKSGFGHRSLGQVTNGRWGYFDHMAHQEGSLCGYIVLDTFSYMVAYEANLESKKQFSLTISSYPVCPVLLWFTVTGWSSDKTI